MIPMKENQASALTIVADRPTKRKNRNARFDMYPESWTHVMN